MPVFCNLCAIYDLAMNYKQIADYVRNMRTLVVHELKKDMTDVALWCVERVVRRVSCLKECSIHYCTHGVSDGIVFALLVAAVVNYVKSNVKQVTCNVS